MLVSPKTSRLRSLRRRGVETKLIIDPPDGGPRLDPDATLIKLVAQAHQWREDILAGRFPTMRSLAKAYDKDERHIARLIPLAFLAPTISKQSSPVLNRPILSPKISSRFENFRRHGTRRERCSDLFCRSRLVDPTSHKKAKTSAKMACDAMARSQLRITQPDHAKAA